MNIAVLGAGHWHSPIYLDIAQKSNHTLVALQDANPETVRRRCEKFQVPGYTDPVRLLREQKVDFAVTLGTFRESPHLADLLIDAGIPFLLEKPGANNASTLRKMAERCREKHLFAAPALIPHWYPAFQEVKRRMESGNFGRIGRIGIQYFAGSAERYINWRCPWVIDPAESPGGALVNLGVLCLSLLKMLSPAPEYCGGIDAHALRQSPIEDFSTLLFRLPGNACAVVETAYMPQEPPEGFTLRVFAEKARAEFHNGILNIQYADHAEDLRYKDCDYRKEMMLELIDSTAEGEPPPVSLDEMADIMEICETFYADCAHHPDTPR